MKLNKFLWNNYKETEQGKKAIELFTNGTTIDIFSTYFKKDINRGAINFIDDLTKYSVSPKLPLELTNESAENLFNEIIKNGFSIKTEKEVKEFKPDRLDFLYIIPTISTFRPSRVFTQFPLLSKTVTVKPCCRKKACI